MVKEGLLFRSLLVRYTIGVARNLSWGGTVLDLSSFSWRGRLEVPKVPMGAECGERVPLHPLGEGSRKGAVPPPQKFF